MIKPPYQSPHRDMPFVRLLSHLQISSELPLILFFYRYMSALLVNGSISASLRLKVLFQPSPSYIQLPLSHVELFA